MNIQLTFFAGILGLVLGTVLAMMRISPVPSLRWAGSDLRHLLRNTPLTIIMVFCVLGLWGQLGCTLSPDFTTNFFRSPSSPCPSTTRRSSARRCAPGVNTVPVGQAEAARAIGLTLPARRAAR